MSNNTCCVLLLMKLDTDQRRSWKKVCCMTLLASSSFLFLSPPFLLLLQWCSSARTRVSICFYFLALLLLRTFFSLKFLSFSFWAQTPKELICFEGNEKPSESQHITSLIRRVPESLAKLELHWHSFDTKDVKDFLGVCLALSLFKVNLIHTKRDWGGT